MVPMFLKFIPYWNLIYRMILLGNGEVNLFQSFFLFHEHKKMARQSHDLLCDSPVIPI